MLRSPSVLQGGVDGGLKVGVTVGQFKAVVEESGGLVQLPPVVHVSSLTALFGLSGDDLQQKPRQGRQTQCTFSNDGIITMQNYKTSQNC